MTADWLSAAVLKTFFFSTGIVVFRSTNAVITPPSVSIPSVNGLTSSNSTSVRSPASTATLNRGSDCNHFVRVDALVRIFTEDATSPTHEPWGLVLLPPTRHDFVNVAGLDSSCVFQRLSAQASRQLLDQVIDQFLELAARDLHRQVLGTHFGRSVMNGRLMSVSGSELSSFFAFSQASCKTLQVPSDH